MAREIIVTSPQGVRLAFEASEGTSLGVRVKDGVAYILELKMTDEGDASRSIGIAPLTWLIELNETPT